MNSWGGDQFEFIFCVSARAYPWGCTRGACQRNQERGPDPCCCRLLWLLPPFFFSLTLHGGVVPPRVPRAEQVAKLVRERAPHAGHLRVAHGAVVHDAAVRVLVRGAVRKRAGVAGLLPFARGAALSKAVQQFTGGDIRIVFVCSSARTMHPHGASVKTQMSRQHVQRVPPPTLLHRSFTGQAGDASGAAVGRVVAIRHDKVAERVVPVGRIPQRKLAVNVGSFAPCVGALGCPDVPRGLDGALLDRRVGGRVVPGESRSMIHGWQPVQFRVLASKRVRPTHKRCVRVDKPTTSRKLPTLAFHVYRSFRRTRP